MLTRARLVGRLQRPAPSAVGLACGLAAGLAVASPLAFAQVSPQVVVTGSVAERALVEAPYAASVVDRQALQLAGPLVNLSEAMAQVPGVVVANRWNFAQDLQISSRGFGARAGFGVRGVRLYSDGIPASGPDGQGQVSHFDLAGAERVEVLRGPFSVLYGNSSGGVISVLSARPAVRKAALAVDGGSFGLRQWRAELATPLEGGLHLRAGLAAMDYQGFRPHSSAERDLASLRLGWQGAHDSVLLTASRLDQPADDPLGLSRSQFQADPYGVASVATQFDTRKTTRQDQAGALWKRRFDSGALREARLSAYGGQREVVQYLAIPAATQANARHGGGVIAFDRQSHGLEGRLHLAWDAFDLVLGLASDRQRDERQGYENFTGSGSSAQLGVIGKLRRDETNRAASDDAYAQAEWSPMAELAISGGLRSGRVVLSAADRYLSNGDDSGSRRFSYTNPVLGVRWQVFPGLNLHASAARGHESPTLGELAYRFDGTGGFNTALRPQSSRQTEWGVKWRAGRLGIDATAFDVRVADEIGIATNAGGRSAFQNVGRTSRQGAELSLRWQPAARWQAQAAATWLDARYRDSFLVCAGVPCNSPTLTVPAGNRVAGTQRSSGFAALAWQSPGYGEFALEWRAAGNTVVNDRNTEAAPGYGLWGLRWSNQVELGGAWRGQWLLRVDNAADRRYAGSVIVNDANGRFYETGAPRQVMLSLRLSYGSPG